MKNFSLYLFALVLCVGLLPVVPRVLPVEGGGDAEVLHLLRTATGEVAEVPLEDYVIGVLTAADYPCDGEALKAVAVCVRSSATYCETHRPTHRDAAACDDPTCCAPFTLERFDDAAVEAAAETRGQTLVYEGETVPATTFASGGKRTASANAVYGTDVPCLRGVENTTEADEPPTKTVRCSARRTARRRTSCSSRRTRPGGSRRSRSGWAARGGWTGRTRRTGSDCRPAFSTRKRTGRG